MKPFFTEEELEEIRRADEEMGSRPQRKEVKPKPPAVKHKRSPEEIRAIRREYVRRYYDKHQEEMRERKRRYYKEHRDELRAYSKQYYHTHKHMYNGTPEARARGKRYYDAHKDDINARKRMQRAQDRAARRIKKIDDMMAALTTEREVLMKEMEAER